MGPSHPRRGRDHRARGRGGRARDGHPWPSLRGATRHQLLVAGATDVAEDLAALAATWGPASYPGYVEQRDAAAHVEVLIEIPARTRNKYEADPVTGALRLDRQLPLSSAYPADYGFVPGTLSEDGDALDALVLLDEPVAPGVLVDAAPLGVLWVEDEHGRDPKLICVLAQHASSDGLFELDDLPAKRLDELEHFFETYKQLEQGRDAMTCGRGDRAAAWREILGSRERARRPVQTVHP